MLKNIKATSIIIFSCRWKTEIKNSKFNKSLQNTLNITIINYKYFTGKYIIYESKGIGKEYNSTNDQLIYEGEYFHGERKGQGREYYFDSYSKCKILIYEGEYLHGKRNGKGKEYDLFGKLIYEGEYLNGKRNGKGKEYENHQLIFDDEFLNGKRIRKGKGYHYQDGILIFEGEYLNGKQWIGTKYLEKK